MNAKWRRDDLPQIMTKLAARPGHEAVRTLIAEILRQGFGVTWDDIKHEVRAQRSVSNASFYKWRAKYGGMDASMVSRMKAIEDENRRLKKMFAELSMQNELLKEA